MRDGQRQGDDADASKPMARRWFPFCHVHQPLRFYDEPVGRCLAALRTCAIRVARPTVSLAELGLTGTGVGAAGGRMKKGAA